MLVFQEQALSLILRVILLCEYLPLEQASYLFHMGELPLYFIDMSYKLITQVSYHALYLVWEFAMYFASVSYDETKYEGLQMFYVGYVSMCTWDCTVQLQPAAFQITTGLRYFVCKTKWYIWLWSRNSVSAKQTYMAFCSVDVLSIQASWCRTWSPNSYTARPGIVVRPHFWGF